MSQKLRAFRRPTLFLKIKYSSLENTKEKYKRETIGRKSIKEKLSGNVSAILEMTINVVPPKSDFPILTQVGIVSMVRVVVLSTFEYNFTKERGLTLIHYCVYSRYYFITPKHLLTANYK